MYVKKVTINNIRSISDFEMTFHEPAGWHVIIGDNGAGKSTVVKSIALAMLDIQDINAARQNWSEWLKNNKDLGFIEAIISPDITFDHSTKETYNKISFERESNKNKASLLEVYFRGERTMKKKSGDSLTTSSSVPYPPPTPTPTPIPVYQEEKHFLGWFSVGYGPFRRFSGGESGTDVIYQSNPHLGAHFSIFGEGIALSEAVRFLRDLYIEESVSIRKNQDYKPTLKNIMQFINETKLLPHGAMIADVDLDGVCFKDGYGNIIASMQMSDGYRSILCLMFELIRQLIRSYGEEKVFENVNNGQNIIDLPGVVLIDEIDAHLHPTWQTRIGEWFTMYFPKIQFIVTTHSPLVCRACEKGSIWRLAAPGSDIESGEVTGIERERLIYGNILDAYGTELFGQSPVRSGKSEEKLERLGHLNMLSAFGKITEEEDKERLELQKILSTDDPTGF
ncbi:AAA family ATPase [Runella sp.]|uniref:AAA family ATPase n=1 Tax=Runella sp. TaxID=1960881 RepID=UPI003D0CCE34